MDDRTTLYEDALRRIVALRDESRTVTGGYLRAIEIANKALRGEEVFPDGAAREQEPAKQTHVLEIQSAKLGSFATKMGEHGS